MRFTEHFPKHKASGKVILFLDGYRAPYYCYRLLLKIVTITVLTVTITVCIPYSLWIRDFWAFKALFKSETAACKNHSISRGASWGLLGVKLLPLGSVSAFESTGIYPFSRKRVPKYVFSISDTGENVTSMETAPSNNGSGMCTLCFREQLSICVTYLSRTFIKYCGYYTSF
jgi:hypothetical protein